jgi:hypothetical protein
MVCGQGSEHGRGYQFFPWISTDESTGTVNIVYYDTKQISYSSA